MNCRCYDWNPPICRPICARVECHRWRRPFARPCTCHKWWAGQPSTPSTLPFRRLSGAWCDKWPRSAHVSCLHHTWTRRQSVSIGRDDTTEWASLFVYSLEWPRSVQRWERCLWPARCVRERQKPPRWVGYGPRLRRHDAIRACRLCRLALGFSCRSRCASDWWKRVDLMILSEMMAGRDGYSWMDDWSEVLVLMCVVVVCLEIEQQWNSSTDN